MVSAVPLRLGPGATFETSPSTVGCSTFLAEARRIGNYFDVLYVGPPSHDGAAHPGVDFELDWEGNHQLQHLLLHCLQDPTARGEPKEVGAGGGAGGGGAACGAAKPPPFCAPPALVSHEGGMDEESVVEEVLWASFKEAAVGECVEHKRVVEEEDTGSGAEESKGGPSV